MGAGRGSRHHAARLGLRLYSGPADRARVVGAAVGCGQRDGVAGGELIVVPAKAWRRPGPIRRVLSIKRWGSRLLQQINIGGYGSPPSRGRQAVVLSRTTMDSLTLPSSALSTSARDVPASLSSDGEGRRCCLLRAPAPVLFPARWSPRVRGGAARRA